MIKYISYGFLALSCLISINSIYSVQKKQPRTLLLEALEKNEFEKAEQLLADGANPNAKYENMPYIVYFALHGNTHAINILLMHGVDINSKNNDGRSAVTYAAAQGHIETLQEILNANPAYLTDDRWYGPHHTAAGAPSPNQPLIIRILHEYFAPKGIAIDVHSKSQMTPLMNAARHGRLGVVETCLELGASQYCQDNQGKTAIMHCLKGMENQGMHGKITSNQKLEYYNQFQGILTLLSRNPETRSILCNSAKQSARDIAIQSKQSSNWDAALSASGVSPFSRDRVAPARYTFTHLPTLSAYFPRNYR